MNLVVEGKRIHEGPNKSKEVKEKTIELSSIKGQKWLVQKKGRHIITFPYEPDIKDLTKYGPGTYNVMFTKPSFSFCKSITVPSDLREKVIKRKKQRPRVHIDDKEDAEPTKITFEKVEPPPIKVDYKPISQAPISIQRPQPIPEPAPQREEIKVYRCENCKEVLGFHRFVSPNIKLCEFCEKPFCSKKCYDSHNCPNSYTCFSCIIRSSFDYYIKNRFCGNTFCTLKCANKCQDTNGYKRECEGCEDYIEEYEKGELLGGRREGDDEEIICLNCECSSEEFEIYVLCRDCKDNEDVFCSWKCFNEYHRGISERHKGVRVDD